MSRDHRRTKLYKALAAMTEVRAWGSAYTPPKGWHVCFETSGMSVKLFLYVTLEWPSEENSRQARAAAESARQIFLDQTTEKLLSLMHHKRTELTTEENT